MEVTINATPVKEDKNKTPDKWEVQCAVDTLIRAEEIKQNPELLELAMKEIEKKKEALGRIPKSLADLKSMANDMDDPDEDD